MINLLRRVQNRPRQIKNKRYLQKIAQNQTQINIQCRYFNIVVTFGTFDLFHKWHEFYLSSARSYGDELVTIIARDSTVEKMKWFTPSQDERVRKKSVEDFGLCTHVLLGDIKNPLISLQKAAPDVICLGYDQRSFPELLQNYVRETNTVVIRMDSFEPEQYKSSKLRVVKDVS